MLLIGKLIQLIFKLVALLLFVTFEFTLGLPVLFLTFSVATLLTSRTVSKYVVFVSSLLLLSAVYNVSLYISFFAIANMYLGFKYLSRYLQSNIKRFFILLLFSTVVIFFAVGAKLSVWLVVYLLLSNAISVVFLVKFLFKNYGFLGSKLQSKYSFLR